VGLTDEESISLRHLYYFLKDHDVFFVIPKNMRIDSDMVTNVIKFEDHYFKNIQSYSKLLLSKTFYERFNKFEYILIYQLDCLVFSSQLLKWTQEGHDYIGAPLFKYKNNPHKGLSRVGNGGFCLRNVEACLNVLTSRQIPAYRAIMSELMPDVPKRNLKKRFQVVRAARRGVQWYTSHYTLNEDLFWSDRARLFDSSFRIAPVRTGLRFAFDAHPRYCFEINDKQLPFGAHAWAKWDREFWEPHLLTGSEPKNFFGTATP
jgi:hypothetical protein